VVHGAEQAGRPHHQPTAVLRNRRIPASTRVGAKSARVEGEVQVLAVHRAYMTGTNIVAVT